MTFSVGSLVRARGREWVVLPGSEDQLLMIRPLGGTEDEVTGIFLPLEPVESAQFALPDPDSIGDFNTCRLLRDAVRLGFRSSAGPFRSFARIAVEPRPYQLVPLLMALKLDPVRMLIADDVGIGKTIEAGLIARELLDRGEIRRLAVLCPPHLTEQWQAELSDKFHIDAESVLPGTVSRLERGCGVGQSLFDVYPYVVVSTDLIKSDRRRGDFLRACPELVIVDEAHTCSWQGGSNSGRHQRHQLLKGVAADLKRHLILVTATPHSGKEEAFRSLLTLLDPEFANLPADLSGPEMEKDRRRLARQMVQRRRADIRHYLDADTPFPDRLEREDSYRLSHPYKALFGRVLDYARETVRDSTGTRQRQRVRWWSALALLRALASSPAAASATLRSRAAVVDAQSPEEADEIGRRTVLDLEDDEAVERLDVNPGADLAEQADDEPGHRRRLLGLARAAEALQGDKDEKLKRAVKLVQELLSEGHSPILFCRFIATADYVAAELRRRLPKGTEVVSVTGSLPPAEREERVLQLAQSPKRVLVCTDCLSEGINLQDHFDAILHYDLSWNPTRHEQREGRVDRYGQPSKTVKAITYYGLDNQIDGIVLDVLIKKHRKIRSSLGYSVPVPVDTNTVLEAILEGLLLRNRTPSGEQQGFLPFEETFEPAKEEMFSQWEAASEREKRSRTVFAQETIKPDEVVRELKDVQSAIGTSEDVARFTREALLLHRATVSLNGRLTADLSQAPQALREAVGNRPIFQARFELPVADDVLYLNRTHPVVEGLATFVLDTALDSQGRGVARRAGVIRTSRVSRRTTLLVLRYRYHIITRMGDEDIALLAEDCQSVAFAGPPDKAEWLGPEEAEALLGLQPEANITPDQAADFVRKVVIGFEHLVPKLDELARARGEQLLEAHRRVRQAARQKGVTQQVVPKLPPDVLSIHVYLPKL